MSVAKQYSRGGFFWEDLVQHGNLGLVEAVDRFEPYRGFRFSTFAVPWIKNGIYNFFEEQEVIRLPAAQVWHRRRIYRFITEYVGRHGREPESEEVAQYLNKLGKTCVSARGVDELLRLYENLRVSSLNVPVGEDGSSEKIDFVEGKNGKDFVKYLGSASIVDYVHNQVGQLDTDVLTRKVLEDILFSKKSLQEVGALYGLRTERVRQKYSRGIRLLRNSLQKDGKFMDSISLK